MLLISSVDPQVKQGLVRLKQIPPFFTGIHLNLMVRITCKCFDPSVNLSLLSNFFKAFCNSRSSYSASHSHYAVGVRRYAVVALLGNSGMEICICFLWWLSFNLTAVTAADSFWRPFSFSQIMYYCSRLLIGHLLMFETLRQYPFLWLCISYKKMRSVSCLISFHLGSCC